MQRHYVRRRGEALRTMYLRHSSTPDGHTYSVAQKQGSILFFRGSHSVIILLLLLSCLPWLAPLSRQSIAVNSMRSGMLASFLRLVVRYSVLHARVCVIRVTSTAGMKSGHAAARTVHSVLSRTRATFVYAKYRPDVLLLRNV